VRRAALVAVRYQQAGPVRRRDVDAG